MIRTRKSFRGNPLPEGDRLKDIIHDYVNTGMSLYDLGLKYNDGAERLKGALQAAGVKIRSRAEQNTITQERKRRDGRQFTFSAPGSKPKGVVPQKDRTRIQ